MNINEKLDQMLFRARNSRNHYKLKVKQATKELKVLKDLYEMADWNFQEILDICESRKDYTPTLHRRPSNAG